MALVCTMNRCYRAVNRTLNVNPEPIIDANMESSIKKTTSLIKKLRNIRSSNCKEILYDIDHLKLDMYLPEIIESLLLNLSESISMPFFDVIQLLHRKYRTFHQNLLQEVKIRFSSSIIQHLGSQRTCELYGLCILSIELYMLNIFREEETLINSIEKFFDEYHGYDTHAHCTIQFLSNYFEFFSSDGNEEESKDERYEFFDSSLKKNIKNIFMKYNDKFQRHCLRKMKQINNSLSHWRKVFENKGLTLDNEREIINMNHHFNEVVKLADRMSNLLGSKINELKIDAENIFELDTKGSVIFLGNFKNESLREAFSIEEKTFYSLDLQGFEGSNEIFDKKYEIDPDIIQSSNDFDEISTKAEDLDYIFKSLKVSNTPSAIDKLSKETIGILDKIKVKNLVDIIILCSREKNELIPLLARYVAQLSVSRHEIGHALSKSLLGSYFFLVKNPASSKSRNRICRFIAELVKFQIVSQNQMYFCLRATVEYFCPQNINAYNILIENCGRFLYSYSENHIRLSNLNELMIRKRSILTPNAEDICSIDLEVPKEYQFYEMPQYFRFLESCFHKEEDFNTILLTFRKVNWGTVDVFEFLKLCLDSFCSDILSIEKLAKLISSLFHVQKRFVIIFVDYLIELLLQYLDSLSTSSNRKMENSIYFLSYLFVYGLLESDQLISLILIVSLRMNTIRQSPHLMHILGNVHKICWKYLRIDDRNMMLNLVYNRITTKSIGSYESLMDISEESIQGFVDNFQSEGIVRHLKDEDRNNSSFVPEETSFDEELDENLLNNLVIESISSSDKRTDYFNLLRIDREKFGSGVILRRKNKTIIRPI